MFINEFQKLSQTISLPQSESLFWNKFTIVQLLKSLYSCKESCPIVLPLSSPTHNSTIWPVNSILSHKTIGDFTLFLHWYQQEIKWNQFILILQHEKNSQICCISCFQFPVFLSCLACQIAPSCFACENLSIDLIDLGKKKSLLSPFNSGFCTVVCTVFLLLSSAFN